MTRQIVFRTAAKRDVAQLAERSEREWGKRRTRRYLDKIEAKIAMLADNPMLGHDAEMSRPNLRRMNSGRHAVFYVVGENRIEAIRVLHVASDFERWV